MFLPASLKEEAGKKSQRFQYYKKNDLLILF